MLIAVSMDLEDKECLLGDFIDDNVFNPILLTLPPLRQLSVQYPFYCCEGLYQYCLSSSEEMTLCTYFSSKLLHRMGSFLSASAYARGDLFFW